MDQHEGEAGENEQTYHARDITASYVEYGRIEDKAKLQMVYKNSKIQCRRDLEDEKNKKVKVEKTVIYHMTNPSTYFTGAAPHTSRAPIDLDAQDKIRNEMREHIIFTLKQVRLQQIQNSHLTDMKSPISHIFRKLKRTEPASIKPQSSHSQLRKAASALNISQLYQRVAKDQISYFTIQCNVRTDSATTVVSGVSNTPASIFVPPEYNKGKRFSVSSVNVRQQQQPQQQKHTNTANGSDGHRRLSHRVSMAFMSSSTSGLNVQEEEHCKQNIIEMIKIIRKVCELLGITYYQSSSSQLSCLLTLRNYKKRITQQQPHSPIRQQQSLSNASNNTQYSSGANNSSHSLFISKFFTSNDRLSDMNKQHASNISKNSHASSASSGWWSRQVHRISAQFNSQSIVTGSGIIVGNSSHDLLAMGRQTQEEQIKLEIDDKDSVEDGSGGHALFTIDVSSIHKQQNEDDELPVYVIALKYSKSSGSNTVFKFAKGWIQNILCDQHATNEEVFNRAMEEENIKLAQYQKYYNGETVTAI
jgi:hypothetical protein